jgi:hypothetical protein
LSPRQRSTTVPRRRGVLDVLRKLQTQWASKIRGPRGSAWILRLVVARAGLRFASSPPPDDSGGSRPSATDPSSSGAPRPCGSLAGPSSAGRPEPSRSCLIGLESRAEFGAGEPPSSTRPCSSPKPSHPLFPWSIGSPLFRVFDRPRRFIFPDFHLEPSLPDVPSLAPSPVGGAMRRPARGGCDASVAPPSRLSAEGSPAHPAISCSVPTTAEALGISNTPWISTLSFF